MRLNKLLILLILINYSLFAFDSVEVLNPNITIHKSGYFKTDKDLTPQEALNQNFESIPQKAVSFGFDSDTYWFIFEISNKEDEQCYLDSRDLLGSYYELYIYKNNQLLRDEKSGFYIPRDEKSINTFSSRFNLENDFEKLTYLVKVDSDFFRVTSFAFGNEKEVEKTWNQLFVILITVCGIVFSFLIYNGFLYFFTKDKSYFYYCVYMFGLLGINQFTLGFLPFYLGLDGHLSMIFWIFSMFIFIYGIALFTVNFLDLKKEDKKLKSIFFILLGFNAFFVPFHVYTNIIPYSQILWIVSAQILQAFVIFIGFKRYLEGYKPAIYFLIATGGGMFFLLIFMIMIQIDYINYSLLTLNFVNIALVWDIVFFSLALAYRIKLLEEENNKNERLAFIKSKQTSIGELSGNIAHQWRQPLAELSSIIVNTEAKLRFSSIEKEELLKQFTLSSKILKHLSSTIDTFQGFFQNERIETTFCVNDEIKRCIEFVNDSMKNNGINIIFTEEKEFYLTGKANEFSQIILNIVLNAKDMFCQRNIKNREIKIDIKSFNKNFKIEISDNAGGIEIKPVESIFESYITSKDKGIGIGLFIVKTIVEQKFNGKIEVINNKSRADETLFLLIFP